MSTYPPAWMSSPVGAIRCCDWLPNRVCRFAVLHIVVHALMPVHDYIPALDASFRLELASDFRALRELLVD